MSGKLQTVHLRVNDAVTGKPTPCRIRITDATGEYYAPLGRLTRFASGPDQAVGGNVYIGIRPHAYIDGTCEINLPAGSLHVAIDKGPEYKPVRADIQLIPGKLALRFTLERWVDLREAGWYSADMRTHFLSPHAALLEGEAEGLAIVNLLAVETSLRDAFGQKVKAFSSLLAFSGQQFAVAGPECGVAVNTLNRHPVLGALALLNSHRVVYPLSFGGPDGLENWTLADWCDQCHRKAGLVVWVDAAQQPPNCGYGEALADLILGKVDAFELDHFDGSPFDGFADWMRILDAGISLTLVGASGKASNGRALGVLRTYAHLEAGQALTYKAWIEAVRAGRTFITNGPLLTLCVNGCEPTRSALQLPADALVQVRAEVRSWLPFDCLAVTLNGRTLESIGSTEGPPYHAVLEFAHSIGRGGRLIATCVGDMPVLDRPAPQRVFACTSPIYLGCTDGPTSSRADAVRRLIGALDESVQWIQTQARCESEQQQQRLLTILDDARRVLEGRLVT